jgi:hypothetical protein
MDAYPMLARCAARQLPEDALMFAHLLRQHGQGELLRPNLLLETGPPRTWGGGRRDEHGTLVPMLLVKAG